MTVERKTPRATRTSPISSGCWWPRCFAARFFFRTREGVRGFSRRFLRRLATAGCHSTPGRALLVLVGVQAAEPLEQEADEPVGVDSHCDVRVRLPGGAAPNVDDCAAAAERRLTFDLDVQPPKLDQVRPDHLRDRNSVMDRRA